MINSGLSIAQHNRLDRLGHEPGEEPDSSSRTRVIRLERRSEQDVNVLIRRGERIMALNPNGRLRARPSLRDEIGRFA